MYAFSVRAKLTLLYSLVTFTGLVFFGLLTYGLLHYALIQGKKTHLDGREARLMSALSHQKCRWLATLSFGSIRTGLDTVTP